MANPVCAQDCSSSLSPVDFNFCNPETHLSEIVRIFVGKANTAPFVNPEQPAEWVSRVSEESVIGNDYLRPLTVIGDKPAPTPVTITLSNNREVDVRKDHVINFTIDETNQKNHDFLRSLECGGQFRIWYETADGLMFGGKEGILGSMRADMVLERGTDAIMVINGTHTWKSKFTEERNISPIFGQDLGGTPPDLTFDTTLTFEAAVTDSAAGVSGTVAAIDPDARFEFNAITPQVGTPASMTVNINGSQFMTVDFTTDYLGRPFKVYDNDGVGRVGSFTNGTINV